jgi:hypothetical protein
MILVYLNDTEGEMVVIDRPLICAVAVEQKSAQQAISATPPSLFTVSTKPPNARKGYTQCDDCIQRLKNTVHP